MSSVAFSRCAIVVIWDRGGELQPYMQYYLKALSSNCSKLVVVFNGLCKNSAKEQVLKLNAECLIRPNEGYDFFAYKFGLEFIGFDQLKKFDQLILCNSSCYGPLVPFNDIFFEMNKFNCDFWGITQWVGPSCPTHIQSYFYAFNKRLIKSDVFHSYWNNLTKVNNRLEAIVCLESRLTSYFQTRGFAWRCYIPKELYHPQFPDCTMNREIVFNVLEKGLPFLKRKLVSSMDTHERAKLNKHLQKIAYPVYLINEDIAHTSFSQNLLKRDRLKAILRRKYTYIIFHRVAQNIIYLYVRIRNIFL